MQCALKKTLRLVSCALCIHRLIHDHEYSTLMLATKFKKIKLREFKRLYEMQIVYGVWRIIITHRLKCHSMRQLFLVI